MIENFLFKKSFSFPHSIKQKKKTKYKLKKNKIIIMKIETFFTTFVIVISVVFTMVSTVSTNPIPEPDPQGI